MENAGAPIDGALQRNSVPQVPIDDLNVQIPHHTGRAHQCSDRMTTFQKLLCNVPADESARAGYQDWTIAERGIPHAYRNAQFISLSVSLSFALIPSAADGSNPQCTMQWSQRGSFPAP